VEFESEKITLEPVMSLSELVPPEYEVSSVPATGFNEEEPVEFTTGVESTEPFNKESISPITLTGVVVIGVEVTTSTKSI
jgi:hypothetical protein|tara:strand:- start:573 stop:812 length:240 start_codon:yes stop_codon:yes gene_type:complete